MRPEWTAAAENIAIGCRWLREVEQPDDAVVSQFGRGEHSGGGLRIQFAAGGWHRSPPGSDYGYVVFDLSLSDEQARAKVPPPDPFTQEEIDEFGALLRAGGVEVISQWNGAGLRTGSFGIRGVNPSQDRAYRNYGRGCPIHGSVFCGERAKWGQPDRDDDETRCTWFSRGTQALVPPGYVVVARDAPPESHVPDDDQNLDAVRRALALIGPLLDDLGIPLQTMAAGRRGRIDGEPPDLSFEPAAGHGVLFPAETAVRLIELARLAAEFGADL